MCHAQTNEVPCRHPSDMLSRAIEGGRWGAVVNSLADLVGCIQATSLLVALWFLYQSNGAKDTDFTSSSVFMPTG